jgi:hypothetical protein
MGRAKIESKNENTITTTVTSCSVKFNFPISEELGLGEFIKMERKGTDVTLHFTKKNIAKVAISEEPIIVNFN